MARAMIMIPGRAQINVETSLMIKAKQSPSISLI